MHPTRLDVARAIVARFLSPSFVPLVPQFLPQFYPPCAAVSPPVLSLLCRSFSPSFVPVVPQFLPKFCPRCAAVSPPVLPATLVQKESVLRCYRIKTNKTPARRELGLLLGCQIRSEETSRMNSTPQFCKAYREILRNNSNIA